MSQYSNAQTPTNLEKTSCNSCGSSSESTKPITFDGKSQNSNGNSKLGAVTAGHSSKVGKVG